MQLVSKLGIVHPIVGITTNKFTMYFFLLTSDLKHLVSENVIFESPNGQISRVFSQMLVRSYIRTILIICPNFPDLSLVTVMGQL